MEAASSNTPQQNGPTIITIELYDNSLFKFPVSSSTTPKDLILNTGRKFGIGQISYFGMQCLKSMLIQYGDMSSTKGSLGTSNDNSEEKVFLVDDIPILDQIVLFQKAKLTIALKYVFNDPRKELYDQTTLTLIYLELAHKYRNTNCDHLNRDQLITCLSLQIYIKYQLSSGLSWSFLDDAKSFIPITSLSGAALDSFNEEALRATKTLFNTSIDLKEAIQKFLMHIRQSFPNWFSITYECLHTEKNQRFLLDLKPEYLSLRSDQTEYNLHIPYKNISSWSFELKHNEDGIKRNLTAEDERKTGEKIWAGSSSALAGGATEISSLDKRNAISTTNLKSKFGTISKKSTKGYLESSNLSIKEKNIPYNFSLSFLEDDISALHLTVVSPYQTDRRIIELLSFYTGKREHLDKQVVAVPLEMDKPMTCTAICDHAAQAPNELMFLVGDQIKILKKLEFDQYLGECQGIQGIFKGSMVTFNSTEKAKSLSTISRLKDREVLNVCLLDGTKKSFIVTENTTGKDLVQMMSEKLEISESLFFGISDITEGTGRWLLPKIPVSSQGIRNTSKLVFKLRLLYHDVAELTDPMLIYLYYIQVKSFVLGTSLQLTENDVTEFAALQLQANFGDFDPEKHKPGYLTSLDDYLPPYFLKMSLSKNENWWQKKMFSCYQQHRGLNKSEAEKAYIAMAQRLPRYGFELFQPLLPENFTLGISRDSIAIFEKSSKNITEKFSLDFSDFTYSNKSLVLEFNFQKTSQKSFHAISLETFDIIRLTNLIQEAELTSNLRKKCRSIRDKFSLISKSFDLLESDELIRINDPKDLFESLKNGVALRNLIHSLSTLHNSLSSEISQEYTTGFPSSVLPAYLSLENVQFFLQYCKDTLKMDDNALFEPEELCNYTLRSFSKVCDVILSTFQCGVIPEKIQELQQRHKSSKSNAKTSTTPFTAEDFSKKVVEEIQSTEKNYLKDLQMIVSKYIKPLKSLVSEPFAEEFLRIFGNIEDLLVLHHEIDKELLSLGEGHKYSDKVGRIFADRSEKFIQLYEIYCINHSDLSERFPDVKSSSQVMNILELTGDTSKDQNIKHFLSSQLIKPVQRIMKYHLLLKELLRYTPQSYSGYQSLEQSLQKMKNVASAVNEIKRKKENESTVLMLQSKIEGYDGPDINQFGPLLYDGKLGMVEKPLSPQKTKFSVSSKDNNFNFFLFEEALFFCKEARKAKTSGIVYKFKGVLPISDLTTKERTYAESENPEENKFSWELHRSDNQKIYIMNSVTFEDKERWINTIADLKTRPRSRKRDIDWKKMRSMDSFASTDSVSSGTTIIRSKLTTTVRKLGGWKKESTDSSENSETSIGTNQTSNSSKDNSTPLIGIAKKTSNPISNNNVVDNRHIEELNALIKRITEENRNLQTELNFEREKCKTLELELAVQKGKNQAYENTMYIAKNKPNSMEKHQILKQLESESKIREELQDQMKKLGNIMENSKIRH